VFFNLVEFVGHVVHSSALEGRNMIALFFMLGWDWYGFYKKRVGTRYAELLFFNLVEFAGHVVHSGVSGVRNIDALFSYLGGPGAVSIKSVSAHVTPDFSFCIQ
jgi:hypothetical protein